jgi:hypothetical protein
VSKRIRDRSGQRMDVMCEEPNLTATLGLVTVAELDWVLGISKTIDALVGPLAGPRARGAALPGRRRGGRPRRVAAGRLGPPGRSGLPVGPGPRGSGRTRWRLLHLLHLHLLHRSTSTPPGDTAGAELRAVARPPASTTVGALGAALRRQRRRAAGEG